MVSSTSGYGGIRHLYQTNLLIQPGNSGGPVLAHDKIVGVAFQGLRGVNSGGQIIPLSVVKHFLTASTRYNNRGFPGLSIKTQELSSSQRKKYGLEETETGIRITEVDRLSSAHEAGPEPTRLGRLCSL